MKTFNYTYDELFNPTLEAFHKLGGSGSNAEVEEEVVKILELDEEEINDIHRGSTTKLTYRLHWARNYLKRYGLLENSSRGIWALTDKGVTTKSVDKEKVKRSVKSIDIEKKTKSVSQDDQEMEENKVTWHERVLEIIQNIEPEKFERLCQRLLRELGFLNVEVTGRSGDGGIDGKGIIRLGGVLSFHIVFQCKRYQGSVGPSIVRDFRGAMVGRADKGLLITTGTFSRDARKEAKRDGAPPIDLFDGTDFVDKLKELKLGIKTVTVEEVTFENDWFKNF